MNLALSIAVYASISKALGLPLRFPGKLGAYHSLLEMTEGGLLARATLWAATEPAAANQAFNINNGDLFRWSEMWPKIAAYFGLECAPPLPMPLESMMADKAMLWRELVQRHQLTEPDYRAVAGWRFADFVFHGTMTCSRTAARRGVSVSISLSKPKPCFSRCSMSSAAVASFPECGIGFPAAQAAGNGFRTST